MAKGQIPGGVAQGEEQALSEDVVYDPDSGQLLTGTLMDYGILRADMLPAISIIFSPVLSTTNPLAPKASAKAAPTSQCPPPPSAWRAIHEHIRG